jgi:hypothetical protein
MYVKRRSSSSTPIDSAATLSVRTVCSIVGVVNVIGGFAVAVRASSEFIHIEVKAPQTKLPKSTPPLIQFPASSK